MCEVVAPFALSSGYCKFDLFGVSSHKGPHQVFGDGRG